MYREVKKAVQISYEAWLRNRNVDALKIFLAIRIVVFDFELFIGDRRDLLGNNQFKHAATWNLQALTTTLSIPLRFFDDI